MFRFTAEMPIGPHSDMMAARARETRAVHDESRRAASKDGPPPTTLQDLEFARRQYVEALERARGAAWPEFDDRLMQTPNPAHRAEEREARLVNLEVCRAAYEEVRSRFSDQRAREREAREEERAERQIDIANGSRYAAWFAGLAALASIATPLLQACHR